MRFTTFFFGLIYLILTSSTPALAHGVHTHNSFVEATIVTVNHDDGTPLAFATFSVFPPHGGPAFAKGQTDSLGRVVFLPNVSGKWEVKVFADDGHGVVTTVEVMPSSSTTTHDSQPQSLGQIHKLITGVGILFGIFGLLVLIQNHQSAKE